MTAYAERLERLRDAARAADLDAVAVVPGPNLSYLAGVPFHASERVTLLLVPVDGPTVFVAPALDRLKAESLPFPAALRLWSDADGPAAAVAGALEALGLRGRRLGVEARRIRFLELEAMARSGAAPVPVDADGVFASLRMRKGAGELAAMRRAVAIAEAAFARTLPVIRPGTTEREVASELVVQLLRAGSGALPFGAMVLTGPSGANPHGVAGERPLAPGDVVTLDWGATFEGYASDITRCVVVPGAAPSPELARAHEVAAAANAAGRAAVRPGATGEAVDRATRDVVEAAGLGAFFVHRTGHGLGLETHEEPDMKAGDRTSLAPGMTFTVEPGIYLPEVGGVRVEDDVAVTEDGSETLTTLPRELLAADALEARLGR